MAVASRKNVVACAEAQPLAARVQQVRLLTRELVRSLEADDFVVQSAPFTSPVKWHLAHTTWFFEHFVLARDPSWRRYDERYHALFNSYYRSLGDVLDRGTRGVLSRPTTREIDGYRAAVDAALLDLLDHDASQATAELVTLGLHHEAQHQELILTDIKHAFALNPLQPALMAPQAPAGRVAPALEWLASGGGRIGIGAAGAGFSFDHERPRHEVLVAPFEIANRSVTNGEYLEFVHGGAYRDPRLWLADGWTWLQAGAVDRPLYWDRSCSASFTLGGPRTLDPAEPVCHVSYYEADAFARWAGARLPSEHEWEAIAARLSVEGNVLESGRFHPEPARASGGVAPLQFFGDVWEWTCSPFTAYPGYRTPPGSLGEYNAKFMCSQYVCRGGSCVTPRDEARATCRNFFYPGDRWQFLGIRLARDAPA